MSDDKITVDKIGGSLWQCSVVNHSVSPKNPPAVFWHFPKRMGIF